MFLKQLKKSGEVIIRLNKKIEIISSGKEIL